MPAKASSLRNNFKRMTVITMRFGDADHHVARVSGLMERGA